MRKHIFSNYEGIDFGISIPKNYANAFDISICYFILIIVDFSYDKCIHKNREGIFPENIRTTPGKNQKEK